MRRRWDTVASSCCHNPTDAERRNLTGDLNKPNWNGDSLLLWWTPYTRVLKVPSVLNLRPNNFVCWTWAEVSFLPFLPWSRKLVFYRKVLWSFYPLDWEVAMILLLIRLIIVLKRQSMKWVTFQSFCHFFFLKGGSRLCSVNQNVWSALVSSLQQFDKMQECWPKAGMKTLSCNEWPFNRLSQFLKTTYFRFHQELCFPMNVNISVPVLRCMYCSCIPK